MPLWPPHKKLSCCYTSLVLCFINVSSSFHVHFWDVVQASCVPSVKNKIKKPENFFWRGWRHFCEILHCTVPHSYSLSKGWVVCQRMWLKTPVADNNRSYQLYWSCRMRKSLSLPFVRAHDNLFYVSWHNVWRYLNFHPSRNKVDKTSYVYQKQHYMHITPNN